MKLFMFFSETVLFFDILDLFASDYEIKLGKKFYRSNKTSKRNTTQISKLKRNLLSLKEYRVEKG